MASLSRPTLVVGARGAVGRLVLRRLLDEHVPVRASARSPRPGDVPEGVDVRAVDLTDPATLAPALEGVAQVFLYAQRSGIEAVADALGAAAVDRVVVLSSGSVVHPTSAGNPIAEEHREVEEALAAVAGLRVVPIRPLVLAANALDWARSITATGRVPLYRPDAATAPIHERDIADVAVEALLGRDDVTDLITGPDRLTQRQQVAVIAAACGRPIEVDELTSDAVRALFGRFMPEEEAEAIVRFLDDAADGNSPATDAVERILGRPATPYPVWARDHADAFR